MKRSEMLKVLKESFLYHMNPDGPAETDEEMYSNILKDLEEAGMSPPRQFRAHPDIDELLEWEYENEKK